jgi:hypothetical protein
LRLIPFQSGSNRTIESVEHVRSVGGAVAPTASRWREGRLEKLRGSPEGQSASGDDSVGREVVTELANFRVSGWCTQHHAQGDQQGKNAGSVGQDGDPSHGKPLPFGSGPEEQAWSIVNREGDDAHAQRAENSGRVFGTRDAQSRHMLMTTPLARLLRCSLVAVFTLTALTACGTQDLEDEDDVAAEQELGPCSALSISGISASAATAGYPATNAIDGTRSTRWSTNVLGATLTADLGSVRQVCAVNLAWYQGGSRRYNFSIALSSDGSAFNNVFTGQSTGRTSNLQTYEFPDGPARYIRLTVNGSNLSNVSAITELRARGSSLSTSTTTAAFTYSPASPSTGQAVSFDAFASTCAAEPCSFTWTDEPPTGGVFPLGTGKTMSFTFQTAATKYVNLVVTDAGTNITLTGNFLQGTNEDNAAIQITQDFGQVTNVSILNNWLDGGGCTLNIAHKVLSSLTGVTANDNRFGRNQGFSSCAILLSTQSFPTLNRNVWDDTNQIVPVQRHD